jgi:hypothetical protein
VQRERSEVARLALAVGLVSVLLVLIVATRERHVPPVERLTRVVREEAAGLPVDEVAARYRRLLDAHPEAAPLLEPDVRALLARMRGAGVLAAAEAARALAPPPDARWRWTREELVDAACAAIDGATDDERLFHVPAALIGLRRLAPDAPALRGR